MITIEDILSPAAFLVSRHYSLNGPVCFLNLQLLTQPVTESSPVVQLLQPMAFSGGVFRSSLLQWQEGTLLFQRLDD